MTLEHLRTITDAFQIEGTLTEFSPYGDGHINSTFVAAFLQTDGTFLRYIIQQISPTAFKNPTQVVNNIHAVTSFLHTKILEAGGDPLRETLTLVPNRNGTYYHWDTEGRFFRVCPFVEGASGHQTVTCDRFYQSARAFGKFARQLDDFDASVIYETIERFHDTEHRYQKLQWAIQTNPMERLEQCQEDVAFAQARVDFCSTILNELRSGAIPLRLCHNDTKLNNVLLDDVTGEGVCVIDLDTVMQGSLLYDFGDAIRFGASSAPEDEENLDLVFCDLEKYEAFVRGYLEETGHILAPREFQLLAHSAILMTLECGMRFLTDHLEGDAYFHIQKENHNLIRARNQFKLVADMEEKLAQMMEINQRYSPNL